VILILSQTVGFPVPVNDPSLRFLRVGYWKDILTLNKFITYIQLWQEAQLSHRGRAMLRIIESFAKSLKITQGRAKWRAWVWHV